MKPCTVTEQKRLKLPMISREILVFDLDGTIRQSKTAVFIKSPDDVELIPGVSQKLLQCKQDGFLIYGWTNQGGVAFGFKNWLQPKLENKEMERLIEEEVGEKIFEDIIVAPLAPDGKGVFGTKTFLRKPSIGGFAVIEHLLFQKRYIPDWSNSMFIGDRPEDEESARLAGIPFMYAEDFFNT